MCCYYYMPMCVVMREILSYPVAITSPNVNTAAPYNVILLAIWSRVDNVQT